MSAQAGASAQRHPHTSTRVCIWVSLVGTANFSRTSTSQGQQHRMHSLGLRDPGLSEQYITLGLERSTASDTPLANYSVTPPYMSQGPARTAGRFLRAGARHAERASRETICAALSFRLITSTSL